MKIKIWALQEIEIDDDVLRRLHSASCELFDSNTESLEDLINHAEGEGEIDLPETWRIHEEFDLPPLTVADLECQIEEAK